MSRLGAESQSDRRQLFIDDLHPSLDKRNMTEQQYIENLRAVLNGTVGELLDDPNQIAALRAGRMRLVITRNGVRKERLVPQPDLVDPSATQHLLRA